MAVTDSRVTYFLLIHISLYKDQDRRFANASPGDKWRFAKQKLIEK